MTLPAVATQDWFGRAARACAAVRKQSIVSVSLATLSARGAINFLEATGACGLEHAGSGLEGEAVHPDHCPGFDWWFDSVSGAPVLEGASLLRSLKCHARWSETNCGRRWARLGVQDLLVGLASLPSNTPGRCVVVEIGAIGGPTMTSADVDVLQAVLPLLAQRAMLAFGSERSTAQTRLTSREQEVLDHLALGKSVKDIAQDLGRSPHTVHDHVKSLHRKLRASSRGELIARALGHIAPSSRSGPAPLNEPKAPVVVSRQILQAS